MNESHPLADRARYSDTARAALEALESRLNDLVAKVHQSRPWLAVTSGAASQQQVRRILSEIMFSVHQYQPLTTEAGFAMLGRIQKNELRLLGSLLAHKTEEAEHGLWASRDFVLLGGDRNRLVDDLTPASFAVAAVWDRMARVEHPLGYLGAEYLFEALTLRVTKPVLEVLKRVAVPSDETGFIIEHATEDIKHTNLIVHWILDVVTRHPQTASHLIRCYDLFEKVYPLPVWDEAFERALAYDLSTQSD